MLLISIQSQPESPEPVASASFKHASTTDSSGKGCRYIIIAKCVSTALALLTFTVKDLKCGKIMRLLRDKNFPCCEAKTLGTYLDLPHSKLQDLSHNNMGNVEKFMIDVLNYWLETDPEKSWSKLAMAVEDCGYGVLAEEIRQKSSQWV